MMNKEITRKEFLLSVLSIVALFVASKVPSMMKNFAYEKEGNIYGSYSYGGERKNA